MIRLFLLKVIGEFVCHNIQRVGIAYRKKIEFVIRKMLEHDQQAYAHQVPRKNKLFDNQMFQQHTYRFIFLNKHIINVLNINSTPNSISFITNFPINLSAYCCYLFFLFHWSNFAGTWYAWRQIQYFRRDSFTFHPAVK